jgi:hypothetical protein
MVSAGLTACLLASQSRFYLWCAAQHSTVIEGKRWRRRESCVNQRFLLFGNWEVLMVNVMNKRTVVKIRRPLRSEIYKANGSSESNEIRKIVLELGTPCLCFLLLSVGI